MLDLLFAKLGIPLEEAQRSFAGEGCEPRGAGGSAGRVTCMPPHTHLASQGQGMGCLQQIRTL